jgi:hypothetical protein
VAVHLSHGQSKGWGRAGTAVVHDTAEHAETEGSSRVDTLAEVARGMQGKRQEGQHMLGEAWHRMLVGEGRQAGKLVPCCCWYAGR